MKPTNHGVKAQFAALVLATLLTGFVPNMAIADTSPAPQSTAPAASSPTSADAAVATRAKTWFAMLQAGKVDRSQFDKLMNDAFTDDKVAGLAQQIKPLGTPTSFSPVDKTVQGSISVYRYKLTFQSAPTLDFIFALDPDGKIAGLQFGPGS